MELPSIARKLVKFNHVDLGEADFIDQSTDDDTLLDLDSLWSLAQQCPSDMLKQFLKMLSPEQHWPPLVYGNHLQLNSLQEITSSEKAMVLSSLLGSNSPSSRVTIVSKFRRYWSYCADLQLSPLPLAEARVCLYIKFLLDEGRIQPKYLPQYVSALSTVASWLTLDHTSMSSVLVKRCLRSSMIVSVEQHAARTILVLSSSRLLDLIAASRQTPTCEGVRLLALILWQFIWVSRESSATYIRPEHIQFVDASQTIIFQETFFKGTRALRHLDRVRSFPCAGCPAVFDLLRRYALLRHGVWSTPKGLQTPHNREFFWALPTDTPFDSRSLSRIFCGKIVGSKDLTLHSLRRSGATALYGAGVPLERIAAWGGWAPGSPSLQAYIDFTRASDPGDHVFFGWLVASTSSFLRLLPAPQDVGKGMEGPP